MATPTTLYMNWTQVQFTPTGGSALVINRVSNVEINPGGQLHAYSGDANRYKVAVFNYMNEPHLTVHSENIGVLTSLSPGAVGAVQAVLNDPKNGDSAGSGAIKYVLANAVLENNPTGGRHMQYATGSASFRAFSSDGTTSPLSATVL
jgi:hypothetical protein